GFLDHTLACCHHDVPVVGELTHRKNCRHLFVRRQIEQVDNRFAASCPSSFRELINLQPENFTRIGKEEEIILGRSDKEKFDKVFILGLDPCFAFAATTLGTVKRDCTPLDVARMGDVDHHILFNNGVFKSNLGGLGNDLGTARIAELLLDLQQLPLDDGKYLRLRTENLLQTGDKAQHFHIFVDDFFPLQTG